MSRPSQERYRGSMPVYAVVILPDGNVLAASDPRRFPYLEAVPAPR